MSYLTIAEGYREEKKYSKRLETTRARPSFIFFIVLVSIHATSTFVINPIPIKTSPWSLKLQNSPFQHSMVAADIERILVDTKPASHRTTRKARKISSTVGNKKIRGRRKGSIRNSSSLTEEVIIKSLTSAKRSRVVRKGTPKLENEHSQPERKRPISKSRRSTTQKIKENTRKRYKELTVVKPVEKLTPSITSSAEINQPNIAQTSVVTTPPDDLFLSGDDFSKHESKKTRGTVKKVASRSSTMPGFSHRDTLRAKGYRDGLEIVKSMNGGRTIKPESKSKLGKKHSDQMYDTSVNVPESLIQFCDEIHKISRITPAEEIELGSKTQEAIRIQNIYDDLYTKLERNPTDAEYCAAAGKINMETLRQAVDEGIEAKNRLVTSNLRMVQRVVNVYLRNGLGSQYNAGDLMQDGILALIRAAEKFEPQRGFRFSTYAMYWIRASVKRSQILQSRVIDVPQRLHENYKKIQKITQEFQKHHNRKPRADELCELTNLTEAQLIRTVKAMEQRTFSLDAEIVNPMRAGMGKDDSSSQKQNMHHLIQGQWDEAEMTQIERKFLKEDLIQTLKLHLDPYEVDLILLRYGLIDEKTLPHGFAGPLTIRELSNLVGIKPDKVRRMINSSLRHLKHSIAEDWENQAV